MISPNRIKYAGIFSDELNMPDLIMDVAIDGDNGEVQTFLNRESVASESYDGRYKRIYQFKYSETFSPKFTFFKKDLSNFEMDEVRTTLKWLTSKDTTALLETYYDDSNVKHKEEPPHRFSLSHKLHMVWYMMVIQGGTLFYTLNKTVKFSHT